MKKVKQVIEANIALKQKLLDDTQLLAAICEANTLILDAFRGKKKFLLCGNGGSAADAQHLATEFSGRFYKNRPALFAEALHVNTSSLTAISNDFGFDESFARMVESKGSEGDVLMAISTSGNSQNIVRACEKAKELGLKVIGLTGESGGKLVPHCDLMIKVPSKDTPRIQECHILIGHIICEIVELKMFD